MATYAYVAKNESGEEITGFLSAANRNAVVSDLHSRGLVVIHVAEDLSRPGQLAWRQRLAAALRGRTSVRDLALFSRQLATVLETGIPLVRGLNGLASDAGSRTISRAVKDLSLRLARGENLSDAMAAHPECFDRMYISMVRAGEQTGTLDQIVDQLALYLEKVDSIQNQVRSALAYPIFVLLFALGATTYLLLDVVPDLQQFYTEMGHDLPRITVWLLGASSFLSKNLLISVAGTAAVLLLIFIVVRTRPGRYLTDSLALNLPIFGPLVRKAVMSRFARTFGTILSSGLPLLGGLDLVRDAVDNAVVARSVAKVKERVSAGHGITESFRATGTFPEMVLQLMATGEESGQLDAMLLKTSEFYDRQVEATVAGLSRLLEPLMIVIVAALVGFIVLSIYVPIFQAGEAYLSGGLTG